MTRSRNPRERKLPVNTFCVPLLDKASPNGFPVKSAVCGLFICRSCQVTDRVLPELNGRGGVRIRTFRGERPTGRLSLVRFNCKDVEVGRVGIVMLFPGLSIPREASQIRRGVPRPKFEDRLGNVLILCVRLSDWDAIRGRS